jgi:hypothetical protein
VLVVPKRLRYFVHRNPALGPELSRILARELTRFYRTGSGGDCAQLHAIERFGSRVNLHVHVHAVVSDGGFVLEEGRLRFAPCAEPSPEAIAALSARVRRRVLLRMLRLGAIPEESARELLAVSFRQVRVNCRAAT